MKFIKPLRDLIVAAPCEEVGRVGALYMPDNTKQSLRTHRKMLVLASGPEARKLGVESGSIVHCSDTWGDEQIEYQGKRCWIGHLKHVNGICEGEAVVDTGRYMD